MSNKITFYADDETMQIWLGIPIKQRSHVLNEAIKRGVVHQPSQSNMAFRLDDLDRSFQSLYHDVQAIKAKLNINGF